MVCAASCRGAEDNGACGLTLSRANSQIAEDLAAFVEDAELLGE